MLSPLQKSVVCDLCDNSGLKINGGLAFEIWYTLHCAFTNVVLAGIHYTWSHTIYVLCMHVHTIITRGRAAASGYSSLLVCLFVCLSESAHLAATALCLQHG